MMAGRPRFWWSPTPIMIRRIAADLMSQAEHDDVAQSVLICDNAEFADAVIAAVDAVERLAAC